MTWQLPKSIEAQPENALSPHLEPVRCYLHATIVSQNGSGQHAALDFEIPKPKSATDQHQTLHTRPSQKLVPCLQPLQTSADLTVRLRVACQLVT